jgi:Zn-dependent protease with chaperone function
LTQQRFKAFYFDGRSSKPQEVTLVLLDDCVWIQEINVTYPLKTIEVGAKLKDTPQSVSFTDGSYCTLLASDFFSPPNDGINRFAFKLESKTRYSVFAILFIALLTAFSLTFGSTLAANAIANALPQSAIDAISQSALSILDNNYLSPSKLSEEKQEAIKRSFAQINDDKCCALRFRQSNTLGANAFALPNGDIILLDDLVYLEEDEQMRGILAILAHEKAHIKLKHGLKNIIKVSISSAIVGYLIGDFSGLAAGGATAIIDAGYSREYEEEADAYAIEKMRELGVSTRYAADIFEKLRLKTGDDYSLLDSHPLMDERIKRFREN